MSKIRIKKYFFETAIIYKIFWGVSAVSNNFLKDDLSPKFHYCVCFFFRAYPSLNLTLHVSKDQQSVQCVLPGLRYDDIDHTGKIILTTHNRAMKRSR